MVCVEAELEGRRLMPSRAVRERFGCDDFDLPAINLLGAEVAGGTSFPLRRFSAGCLDCAICVSFGKSKLARVSPEIYRPRITCGEWTTVSS
jgi:hypothetical protein